VKGNVTTDTNGVQKIKWEYFENLYYTKLEGQEEIDKFLDTCDPPKLNQEDINNLTRSITSNEIGKPKVQMESPLKVLPNF
jgi:hypothetical protein